MTILAACFHHLYVTIARISFYFTLCAANGAGLRIAASQTLDSVAARY